MTMMAQDPDLSMLDSAVVRKVYSAKEIPLLIASVGSYGKYSSLTI